MAEVTNCIVIRTFAELPGHVLRPQIIRSAQSARAAFFIDLFIVRGAKLRPGTSTASGSALKTEAWDLDGKRIGARLSTERRHFVVEFQYRAAARNSITHRDGNASWSDHRIDPF
jgi:hypothetical protein